ncbi:flagellar hook-length control protein FliK [Aurantimonas sp. Leaf443]|uniref:flagellar hook-length control protein FliK n=1 Tax=Aurantimonas sp. Leaf443 TaxID=1736378 RepID=UPI0006FEB43B|nr:flagellar hook-length control protein FliK [Aurantimonas sp. Leaf443]KQT82443.1 hypothetical protein ASG48_15325 [Aurantimonas sp. Leaf443]
MKVQTWTPMPDFAPEPGRAGKGGADYGDQFDRAVRAASKEPAGETPSAEPDERAERKPEKAAKPHERPESRGPVRAPSGHAARPDGTSKGRETIARDDGTKAELDQEADEASATPVDPLNLGQVISSLATVRPPAQGGRDVEGEEPQGSAAMPVLGDEAGTGEGAAEGTGARGTVRLEVLGMETHFEPTVRDVVLVEGSAGNDGAEPESQEAPAIKLSFDEVLQRLDRSVPAAAAQITLPAAPGAGIPRETGLSPGAPARARLRAGEEIPKLDRASEIAGEAAQSVAAGEDALPAPEDRTEMPLPRVAATRREDGEGAPRRSAALEAAAASGADEAGTGRLAATTTGGTSTPLAGIASLTSQVAGRVIDSFGGAGGFAQRQADLPSGQTHLRMQAGGAALKTLTIQLQPEDLGRLDVSMRLIDGKLTLEVAATERHTAQVLASDREGLRKLLEHAGFSLDDGSIVIQTRDVSSFAARPSADAQGQQDGSAAGQNRGGQASGGSDGQSPDRRARGGEDETLRQAAARPGAAGTEAPGRRSGTTYL